MEVYIVWFSQSTKYKEGSCGREGWRNKRGLVVKDLEWPKDSCTQKTINGFWEFDEIVIEVCKLVYKCVLSKGGVYHFNQILKCEELIQTMKNC